MKLVDSHCHLDRLDLALWDNRVEGAINDAVDNHVEHMLCVSITLEDFDSMCELVKPFKNVSLSVGVHPNETDCIEPTVEQLVELSSDERIVAIGETGLDYFRSEGDVEWQRDRFRVHIEAAKQTKKPLIIHNREAKHDTIKVLKEESASDVGGVMHCFVEDWETAKQAMELNFYISFSGIVTFKNAKELKEVAKKMPLEKMLIETDSPYLAPVPYRGKSNQPAYVRHVAEHIAELRNTSVEEIAKITTENYYRLFPLSRGIQL